MSKGRFDELAQTIQNEPSMHLLGKRPHEPIVIDSQSSEPETTKRQKTTGLP
jgi:hypothetical protein